MSDSQKARLLAPLKPRQSDSARQGFATTALIIVILVVAGAVGYFVLTRQASTPSASTPSPAPTPVTTTPNPTPITITSPTPSVSQNETAGWKTYHNEKYGFEFKYPGKWQVISKSVCGEDRLCGPPVLFDTIIETKEHDPLNQAGHIFVLNLLFLESFTEFQKENIQNLTDFSAKGITGKKFQIVYPQYGNSPRQTDYNYILNLGRKTILVQFRSFPTPEKNVNLQLQRQIDSFVQTFSSMNLE